MSEPLTAADLRFINLVAARRFAAGSEPHVEAGVLEAALAGATGSTPFARAATLAGSLLARRVFAVAPLHTALLVLHCSLTRDGLTLLTPQGVLAGMIRGLATGAEDVAGVARWLEDRAVPSASG